MGSKVESEVGYEMDWCLGRWDLLCKEYIFSCTYDKGNDNTCSLFFGLLHVCFEIYLSPLAPFFSPPITERSDDYNDGTSLTQYVHPIATNRIQLLTRSPFLYFFLPY